MRAGFSPSLCHAVTADIALVIPDSVAATVPVAPAIEAVEFSPAVYQKTPAIHPQSDAPDSPQTAAPSLPHPATATRNPSPSAS